MATHELDLQDLYGVTLRAHQAIKEAGFISDPGVRQALALSEEVGEFVGAYRRYRGMARRTDTYDHVMEELADVVIVAWITGHALEEQHGTTMVGGLWGAIEAKLDVIFTRGWRDGDSGE